MITVGTTPDACTSACAHRPHPCNELMPSPTSAPAVSSQATNGTPSSVARRIACSIVSAPASPTAPWCLPPSTRSSTIERPSRSTMHADALSLRRSMIGVMKRGARASVMRESASRDSQPCDRLAGPEPLPGLGEHAHQQSFERAAHQRADPGAVSYTHLRAHETDSYL